ncbi:MAG TPA: ATP-binding domain-containing protein [Actinomycetes bacterium]|nr:ATP-binding domain-containing protein [Actinomycetes bacterium]
MTEVDPPGPAGLFDPADPADGPVDATDPADAPVDPADPTGPVDALAALDLPPQIAAAAARALGDDAAEQVAADPWRLLAAPQLRPDQVDRYARARLGTARPDDRRRLSGLVCWVLARAGLDGHTVTPTQKIGLALQGFGVGDRAPAVEAALAGGRVVDDPAGLSLPAYAVLEEDLADAIAAFVTGGGRLRLEVRQPGGTGGPDPDTSADAAAAVVLRDAAALGYEQLTTVLAGLPETAALILTGDPAELPPFPGPGQPFADLVGSGLFPAGSDGQAADSAIAEAPSAGAPATTIAELAAAVRTGVLPAVAATDRQVVVVGASDAGDVARRVGQLVTDSIPRVLGHPAEAIQVVTPAHRGLAGTAALNRALKERLNPGPGRYEGFDPGDRVVCVASSEVTGLAAGQHGVVVKDAPGALVVDVDGEQVEVPLDELDGFRHGWAVTVQRAHGRHWPAVVAVLPAESVGHADRPLVYTALTRATEHLTAISDAGPAVRQAVALRGGRPRRTRLIALLRERLADLTEPD